MISLKIQLAFATLLTTASALALATPDHPIEPSPSASVNALAAVESVDVEARNARSDDLTGAEFTHQVQRAPDGLFYVRAQVNGEPIDFIVDSGATVTVLNRRDAERLNMPVDTLAKGRIQTASGGSSMRWTHIREFEMGGRTLRDLRAAVVEQGLPVSLLGQNALSRLGTVTMNADTLTIS
jgi:aspartyl protease family protein